MVTDTLLLPRDIEGSIVPYKDTVCRWCKKGGDLIIFRCIGNLAWLHHGDCSTKWHKKVADWLKEK